MYPRWHVLLGAIFTVILWVVFPHISLLNLSLVFLASFLIDFDHYMNAVWKGGSFSLFKSFEYYKKVEKRIESENKKGVRNRSDFQIFHTFEFHILVLMFGFFWSGFFFIFIGMAFHSLLDIFGLAYRDRLYIREYFFAAWLTRKINEKR